MFEDKGIRVKVFRITSNFSGKKNLTKCSLHITQSRSDIYSSGNTQNFFTAINITHSDYYQSQKEEN